MKLNAQKVYAGAGYYLNELTAVVNDPTATSKRGLAFAASSIRKRSAAWTNCWTGRFGQGDQRLHCG
jgi:hypothetical protein